MGLSWRYTHSICLCRSCKIKEGSKEKAIIASPAPCAALDNSINNRFHRKTAQIILKDQEERREGARERGYVMATRDNALPLFLSHPSSSVSLLSSLFFVGWWYSSRIEHYLFFLNFITL
jgi:hypothetical protein